MKYKIYQLVPINNISSGTVSTEFRELDFGKERKNEFSTQVLATKYINKNIKKFQFMALTILPYIYIAKIKENEEDTTEKGE